MSVSTGARPVVRVDLVPLRLFDGSLQVLLRQRTKPPYARRWALPGGLLDTNIDTTLDAAARRISVEKVQLAPWSLIQTGAAGGVKRDSRVHWAMTVAYRLFSRHAHSHGDGHEGTPHKGHAASAESAATSAWPVTRWVDAHEAAQDRSLAFDHEHIIGAAVLDTQRDVREMNFPKALLPEQFTIAELQVAAEAVLQDKLDKVTFRRHLDKQGVVQIVKGQFRTGVAHRPGQLYTWVSGR